jgi:hypothetical protein
MKPMDDCQSRIFEETSLFASLITHMGNVAVTGLLCLFSVLLALA